MSPVLFGRNRPTSCCGSLLLPASLARGQLGPPSSLSGRRVAGGCPPARADVAPCCHSAAWDLVGSRCPTSHVQEAGEESASSRSTAGPQGGDTVTLVPGPPLRTLWFRRHCC